MAGGITSTWADDGGRQWFSAALMLAAALGLLLARLREVLDPLLGPPRLVPVVAGVVAGTALTGAFSSLGPLATTLTGYAGVLLATLPAVWLEGWRRGLLLPVAVAGGVVMTSLCVLQLLADQRWAQLSLLLLLTAIPTALVAVWRPEDRPVALPTAVGCLTGSILLALPDGLLTPGWAALLLTAVYGLAMLVGAELDPASRRPTEAAAGVCSAVAVLLVLFEGAHAVLAALLLVQGLCTLASAWLAGRQGVAEEDSADESEVRSPCRRRGAPARASWWPPPGSARPRPGSRPSSGTRCPRRAGCSSRPARGCSAAGRGRPGGPACSSRRRRRPCWRSSARTTPAPWRCWSSRR